MSEHPDSHVKVITVSLPEVGSVWVEKITGRKVRITDRSFIGFTATSVEGIGATTGATSYLLSRYRPYIED